MQGLFDLAGCDIDEFQAAGVFDNKSLALFSPSEIDRPAIKQDLLARGSEELVGRHQDSTIALKAHLEIETFRWQNAWFTGW
jgi:hypothetical protein